MSNLDKALEWADGISYHPCSHEPEEVEAAKIILNLPDRWVDAEKVLEIADDLESLAQESVLKNRFVEQARRLRNLTTPKLPTLADMTPEERKACQWMQADLHGGGRGVIAFIADDLAAIWFENPNQQHFELSEVTPRPDLPKLKWPGSEATVSNKEKVTADQQPSTSENPKSSIKPEDVPHNEPWLIEADGQKAIGTRYKGDAYAPWAVSALNGSFVEDYPDYEITLIHKLVPETS